MDFATTVLICKDAYLQRKKGTSTEKFDTFSQTTRISREQEFNTFVNKYGYLSSL